MELSLVRPASHAGSWYSNSSQKLDSELESWLNSVEVSFGPAKAIIAPHAGYSYSGSTAAYAYKQITPSKIKRIFILGPSHHIFLKDKCALSPNTKFETPLGELVLDEKIYKELESSGEFVRINEQQDADEHSLEMQFSFVAKIMKKNPDFKIIPIMVGSLSPDSESHYGKIFATYLDADDVLFVISSDFCHWGKRFSYTKYDRNSGQIFESIEKLDKDGIAAIESLNPNKFTEYLKMTKNTICGRHPIGVLLNMLTFGSATNWQIKFIKYTQSSQCTDMDDSSVSYASGVLIAK